MERVHRPWAIQFDENIVLRQLQKDLRDDWFPDPRRFEDIIDQSLVQSIVINNFNKNHGAYRPSGRDVLNIPKPNLTLRYGLETSIADRAVYHALTSYLVPFYDHLMPWNVFSHRYANDAKSRYLFKRAIPAWQDFVGVVRVSIKTNRILLSTDITNYFENIDINKLEEAMTSLLPDLEATPIQKGYIRAHLSTLFDCLEEWSYTRATGLPQNRDASSFLANVYMLAIDKALLGHGLQYFRYMDDIQIACTDEFMARRALKLLSTELRKLGLSVNSGKTKICSADDQQAIDDCLDAGGEQLRKIDAIWHTRSLKPISRSFGLLRELALSVLREGKVDSREFRYCIRRLQALAMCPEFSVPEEYFQPITTLVINVVSAFPAAADQLAQYLRAVTTTEDQLGEIAEYLLDSQKSIYTWQNYKLWTLLVQKEYRLQLLMEHARDIVKGAKDDPNRHGATLYLGALGEKDDMVLIAQKFSSVRSFLGQRIALVAIQELHYRPFIEDHVQPFLREDLVGVYKGLNREGRYVAAPEPISIRSILDVERDYE